MIRRFSGGDSTASPPTLGAIAERSVQVWSRWSRSGAALECRWNVLLHADLAHRRRGATRMRGGGAMRKGVSRATAADRCHTAARLLDGAPLPRRRTAGVRLDRGPRSRRRAAGRLDGDAVRDERSDSGRRPRSATRHCAASLPRCGRAGGSRGKHQSRNRYPQPAELARRPRPAKWASAILDTVVQTLARRRCSRRSAASSTGRSASEDSSLNFVTRTPARGHLREHHRP